MTGTNQGAATKAAEKAAIEAEQNVEQIATEQGDGAVNAGENNLNTEEADRIAHERSERAARAAVTSYFKQQGLSEEEARQAFDAYKTKKAEEAEAERNNLSALQQKLDGYEKSGSEAMRRANLRLVRAEAMVQAMRLNVRPDRVDYAIRLADLASVEVDEHGNPDESAVREALEKVTADLPELLNKTKQEDDESRSGFKLGSPGQPKAQGVSDKIADIFGNKKD